MKIVPVSDKVVVKRIEADQQTRGGIVLPDNSQEQPHQGRVLSVGEGRLLKSGQRRPLCVGEGDRVVFSAYAGATVQVDGDELLVMSEDEILAILR